MRLGTITPQPNERLSYTVAYHEALDDGDEVSEVLACTASPAGLTVTAAQITADRVRLLVSGGTHGVLYKITLRVATDAGEIFEDELMCRVKEV